MARNAGARARRRTSERPHAGGGPPGGHLGAELPPEARTRLLPNVGAWTPPPEDPARPWLSAPNVSRAIGVLRLVLAEHPKGWRLDELEAEPRCRDFGLDLIEVALAGLRAQGLAVEVQGAHWPTLELRERHARGQTAQAEEASGAVERIRERLAALLGGLQLVVPIPAELDGVLDLLERVLAHVPRCAELWPRPALSLPAAPVLPADVSGKDLRAFEPLIASEVGELQRFTIALSTGLVAAVEHLLDLEHEQRTAVYRFAGRRPARTDWIARVVEQEAERLLHLQRTCLAPFASGHYRAGLHGKPYRGDEDLEARRLFELGRRDRLRGAVS